MNNQSAAGTIVDILSDYARSEPSRVFCRIHRGDAPAVPVTYGDILQRGLRFAELYRRHGARHGDTVTIVMRTSADMIYGFLGAILGGFVPSYAAPLVERQEPAHYWEQLRLQLHRIERSFLLVDRDFCAAVTEISGLATRLILAEDVTSVDEPAALHQPSPDDVALLQHSSGTTGGRKGVALSHRSVIEQLRRYGAALALRKDDLIVSWLPLYHDMGLVSSYLLPLLSGTPLVLLDPFEWVGAPWILLERISEYRATLTWLPNFAFHLMARARPADPKPIDLSSMRAFINCSEPCKVEAFDSFYQRFQESGVTRDTLQICYAMAETVFATTQTKLGSAIHARQISRRALQSGLLSDAESPEDSVPILPVGSPIAGVQLKIVGEKDIELADGSVGEVLIAADFMFSGYYQEPELTAAALTGGYYRSGDLGGFLDGTLYITGRKKDVIIVNGKNFYAHDLEAVVNGVAGIKSGRCVAFALPNTLMGSETVCVLAESEAPEEHHPAIIRAIKEAILAHMGLVIGKVAILAPKALIKTTSGKISRKENMERFVSGRI